jgi:hypothetical protein
VLLAVGEGALEARLEEGLAARSEVVACERYPEAAMAAARREYPDAAVVAARLGGEETEPLVEGLVCEGVRVVWLAGCPRGGLDRERAARLEAAGSCEVVWEPCSVEDVVRLVEADERAGQGAGVRDGAGVREAVEAYALPEERAARWGGGDGRGAAPPGGTRAVGDVGAAAVEKGGCVAFLGALPGCGTTRTAIAWARRRLAAGGPVLLVDAHAERAHAAHYLLGRDLDPLCPADRLRSWRSVRGAESLRRCVLEVEPGLLLLALAFDADPEPGPGGGEPSLAPDVAVRWRGGRIAVDLVCRPGCAPSEAALLLRALGEAGRPLDVRAVGPRLGESDRRVWEREIGVTVEDGLEPRGAAAGRRLVADLSAALRACSPLAAATAVDLGAPRGLVGGLAEPRVAWAAAHAHTIVVTRPDRLGAAAADRLLTTLRCEAERAGQELRGEVVVAG